jgi:hypothetical protein
MCFDDASLYQIYVEIFAGIFLPNCVSNFDSKFIE